MKLNKNDIEYMKGNISNWMYENNNQATKELIQCIAENAIKLGYKADTIEMIATAYELHFYTYCSFEELMESEKDTQGMTKDECIANIGKTIFKLSCGWYVQYV